jgi:hypothetical protein
LDDRSHTTAALIVHRPTVRLVISPYLPLVVSPATSVGDPTLVYLSSLWSVAMPQETPAPGADSASLGAINIEVDGVGPLPCDDAGGFLQDWVMHGDDIGSLGSVAPGDVTPTPDSSGTAGLRVSGLLLWGSPGFPPPPID